MVGDGHTMSVAAQIVQHIFAATEGTFQIDHPVLSVEWPQPGGKDLGLSEEFQISLEAELAILEGLLERIDELAAKDFTKHPFWEESSCLVNAPSGCDQVRGRRQERHNGHADEF